MMTPRRSSLAAAGALAAAASLFAIDAAASPWPRPKGQLLLLAPISYLVADSAFDGSGERVDRDRFEMLEFSPLLEYGFTDNLTGGLQPKFRRVEVETDSGTATNSGLAEADAFLRYRLWHKDQAAFSVRGLVKAPIEPDEKDAAALGRDQADAELALIYGNRRSLQGGGNVFYSGELGYRKRYGSPDDQAHLNGYIGWNPGGPWTVVLRSANTIGIGDESGRREVLTTGPSFRKHEAQLMLSRRITDSVSGVVGVSTTFAGENVGAGKSGFVSVVSTF
jgi:hypothetical protein